MKSKSERGRLIVRYAGVTYLYYDGSSAVMTAIDDVIHTAVIHCSVAMMSIARLTRMNKNDTFKAHFHHTDNESLDSEF
jgi:hypothetical protein